MLTTGVYCISGNNLVDIGKIFIPYTTGTKVLNTFFTKDLNDIGTNLQPYMLGTQRNIRVYTKNKEDIGTYFQVGPTLSNGLRLKLYTGYFGNPIAANDTVNYDYYNSILYPTSGNINIFNFSSANIALNNYSSLPTKYTAV